MLGEKPIHAAGLCAADDKRSCIDRFHPDADITKPQSVIAVGALSDESKSEKICLQVLRL